MRTLTFERNLCWASMVRTFHLCAVYRSDYCIVEEL